MKLLKIVVPAVVERPSDVGGRRSTAKLAANQEQLNEMSARSRARVVEQFTYGTLSQFV